METSYIERANAIQLAAQTVEITHLKASYAELDRKLDQVLAQMAEARGGWKTLMLIGGAAGTLGGTATWFFSHLKG